MAGNTESSKPTVSLKNGVATVYVNGKQVKSYSYAFGPLPSATSTKYTEIHPLILRDAKTNAYSKAVVDAVKYADQRRIIAYVNKLVAQRKKETQTPPSNNVKPVVIQGEVVNPHDWKWNLPPHKWSRPMVALAPDMKSTAANDMYRRGRLWWKMSDTSIQVSTRDGVSTTNVANSDRKYGFQFLWNPEQFRTQVSVQMDVTPTAQDRFLGGAGFFPATEGIEFNIRIDRTNDFACAAAAFKRPDVAGYSTQQGTGALTPATRYITAEQVEPYVQYYQHGSFEKASPAEIQEKLIDLFQRGTLADIEYLYKAINGPGPSGSSADSWVNGRGIATSAIGFLTPTLLNVDIGPLSYQGYVSGMNITHTAFTPDMVPIRTDMVISLQLLATAGLTKSGSPANTGNRMYDVRKAGGK